MPFDGLNLDLEDGAFLILPIIGMVLVVIGIFLIVVAYFPDLIPEAIEKLSLITATIPEEISSFFVNYYNAFKPVMLEPPYMLLIGLGCIGGGLWCMLYEYLDYRDVKKAFSKER